MTPQKFLTNYFKIHQRYSAEGDNCLYQMIETEVLNENIDELVYIMEEYARIMCQKQKEICAEEGKNCRYGFYEELALNSPFPKELQDVKD